MVALPIVHLGTSPIVVATREDPERGAGRNSGMAEWRNSGMAEWRNRCMPPTRNRKLNRKLNCNGTGTKLQWPNY